MEMTQEVWDRIKSLEDRVASQERQIATLEDSTAKSYSMATATDRSEAAVSGESSSYGHPALLRRLDKHGIRLHPEDMDDFDGSGSQKYNAATNWTKDKGEGKAFPGLPTQKEADAAVAQGF
jgi:hypothetical protein